MGTLEPADFGRKRVLIKRDVKIRTNCRNLPTFICTDKRPISLFSLLVLIDVLRVGCLVNIRLTMNISTLCQSREAATAHL